MKRQISVLFVLACLVLLMGACAAGPNTVMGTPSPSGEISGFWMGLWHGLISVIVFIISLFSDNVHVYDIYNNGGWYNFGFLIGIGAFASGSTSAATK
ncbi:hypothetical protein HQ571_01545 [Candidatus Kuenenbacteria bacterium]|nr:hypothetical protein [Candidatus Kuenenbacteria bacterium]